MEINEYLVKSFQLVRDMENMDFFAGVARLSRTEFRLLREVVMEEQKGRSIISSELARRLGITRSAISQIVTKLEQKGIVKRIDSPTDRKIAYIRIADSAISVFNEQCQEANAIMEPADDVEEGRLAAARRAEDAHEFARTEFEVDPPQRVHAARRRFVLFCDACKFENK